MTEQEKINQEVRTKLLVHDEKFNSFVQSMEDFKKEMKDFKDEMRQQNQMRAEMRAAESAELRSTFQNIQNTLLQMQTSNRNQNVLVIIGVAAMVIAVILK